MRDESRRVLVRELEFEFPQLRWSLDELDTLCQFRFGLASSSFQTTVNKLRAAYAAKYPHAWLQRDVRRTVALQNMKLARDWGRVKRAQGLWLMLKTVAISPLCLIELILSRLQLLSIRRRR